MTRKQTQIRQRESEILEIARGQFAADGYLGLNMDRIAAEMKLAKGTVYNHFSCKEEILLALANQAIEQRTGMFQKAAMTTGKSRQRLAAIGASAEWFVRNFPHHFAAEQLVRSQSFWDKTSEKRRQILERCEMRCMEIVGGIVRDGVASGDLKLSPPTTAESIVFGLWSLSFGAYSIIASSDSLAAIGIQTPYEMVRQNINALLDGLDWRPLSSETDFTADYEATQAELFGHSV